MKINVSKMNADPDDGSRKRKWGSENVYTATAVSKACVLQRQEPAPGTCSLVTAVVLTMSVGRCLVPDIFTG